MNNLFNIKYNEKSINLEIESAELHLWVNDGFKDKIGLFINIEAKDIDIKNENGIDEYYIKPRIHTEWLEIPLSLIKNKNFRSIASIKVDFSDSGEMNEIERMVCTESPGALYVEGHGTFEKVLIELEYIEKGVFKVSLKGSAEFNTPFNVSAEIPLEVKLNAYDNSNTKEGVLSYFNSFLNSDHFTLDWRYRDEDIFFSATPKK